MTNGGGASSAAVLSVSASRRFRAGSPICARQDTRRLPLSGDTLRKAPCAATSRPAWASVRLPAARRSPRHSAKSHRGRRRRRVRPQPVPPPACGAKRAAWASGLQPVPLPPPLQEHPPALRRLPALRRQPRRPQAPRRKQARKMPPAPRPPTFILNTTMAHSRDRSRPTTTPAPRSTHCPISHHSEEKI